MSRGTPGDNYNLKTAAIAAHDASYVLYRTGILSSGYATDASNVNFYNLTLNNKLHVKGDFQVDGSMTEIYSSRLDISDGLIELATSNASDSIDIGFYGQYNDGSDKYTGLFRDRTGKSYQLFNNCSSRPNQAGVTAGSYEYANLALNDISLSTINGEQNGALAISKSGVMTTVNGTLNVKQAVTLDETLTVAADKTTQLGGNVTIKGDIDTVAAGAMTLGGSTATSIDIADAGVITTVKGTLNVDQAVTLDETLTLAADKTTQLGGNVTIKGDIDTVAAGAMTLGGSTATSIDIADAGVITTVKGTLNVDQAVTLDETLTVAADKTTQLGGNVTIKGDVDTVAAGAMTLGGSTATSIDIADAGVITTVKGTLNVDQAVTLDETLTVAADKTTQLGGNVTIKGDIDTVAAGAMTLGGSTATSIDIADAGVITTVKGTLNVDQAVTLDETLTVAADKTTQLGGNVTIKGDVDTVAAGAMTLGGSTATSIDIADAGVITTVKGTLNVDQAVTLDSTLAVSGTITATDDITAFFDSSDRRLKKNVETIDSALSIINNLRGVRFDWNEEAQKLNENVDLNKRELGVIAQEIEKELPEVIKEGLGGYMAVRYEKITPLLIQCIKEQQTMIKQQDERISKLENSQN